MEDQARQKPRRWRRLIHFAVGGALMAAGILGIVLLDLRPEPEEEPEPIRPLKTLVVRRPGMRTGRRYPGKVSAFQDVQQAFEVGGRLIEKLVYKGDRVKKGQLMARLDPRDFENELNAALAEQAKEKANRDRAAQAFSQGVATAQELTNAEAKLEVASAAVKIKEKALADSRLYAMFTGLVADTYVDNFANVKRKEPIVLLHDLSKIEIEINVPEERIALARKTREDMTFAAVFEYLPGREFELRIKEFATAADPATQTFALTLVMPTPADVHILPGMTATVQEYLQPEEAAAGAFAVPIDVVPVDGVGDYFVWKVELDGDDIYTVRRADVKVGEMAGDKILVVEGLRRGDRIAAAAVHMLTEGRRVRLFEPVEGGDGP